MSMTLKQIKEVSEWIDRENEKGHTWVHPHSIIHTSTEIGRGTKINGPITITGIGTCHIGNMVAIGHGVKVITSGHDTQRACLNDWVMSSFGFSSVLNNPKTINIGHASWIGHNAVIMASVGLCAIVGAGAVVTKPVEEFGIAVGNPANIIRYRFDPLKCSEIIESRFWEWDDEKIRENRGFFETRF